ncbi:hypothetical protein PTTG_02726 [Puccinia triticina 1-1 BBBD Race 1]|uniref:Uncharacterized protein n=1 Tax=Puccinia triticina (isolate 1-1 / race 1 (BBBD)) TaxID=630390 RepID=A0A180GJE7_PUCT1|nr:hypothetical protein PTTG_02726 [Puccinia triticina 1-1 BBBD Race 1]
MADYSPLSRYSTHRTVHFSPSTTTNTPSQKTTQKNQAENHQQWIQDLVETTHDQRTSFNHFPKPSAPSTPTTATTTPMKPAKNTTTTPIQTSSYFSSSTPLSSSVYNRPSPSVTSTPRKTPAPSSRVPISLNPTLATTGLILGQKSILDRIRVNLLSLIVVWILTSTRIYNQCIQTVGARLPFLSVPLQVTEWLLLVLLCWNLLEGYYRLKTQTPVTHVDLPLTPQQKRGGAVQVLHKNPLSVSLGHGDDPGRRSAHSPLLTRHSLLSSSLRSSPSSGSTRRATDKDEVLSRDPTINPLSRSTLHLFKRSVFSPFSSSSVSTNPHSNTLASSLNSSASFKDSYARTSSGFRNVSNQLSLQKLLDENLFPSSTNSTHTPSSS